MDSEELIHLYPTAEIISDELNRAGIECRAAGEAGARRFEGVRLFTGQAALSPDVLYVLRPGDAGRFPGRQYACVSAEPAPGCCLLCPGQDADAVLDALLALFDRCRAAESRVSELVYGNASLQAMCELAASLLDNPICVHDDWFVMIAKSAELSEVMPPDYIMSSSREFLPRIIVEDFMDDNEYLETYTYRSARLWEAEPRCLYVNLWEGSVYRGRMLVAEHHRPFRPADYMLAELVAQRVTTLLGRKRLGLDRPHRGMDDIVFDLLNGRRPEAQEEVRLLNMLNWGRTDKLVCVRLEAQRQGVGELMEHALHSDLFQAFPDSYIMFAGHQQCVILNVSGGEPSMPMLRHRLAPLCRDYCLYAGISSPVVGPEELNVAYIQAQAALERIFQARDDRWIVPFSDCALEYLLGRLQGDIEPKHLVAPELWRLIEYDREKDTRYFETLRAYLLQERDIPRTAERLIIHRTTLLYRLKKIQAIAPLDMDDPWKRLHLLLSLWIIRAGGGEA